MSANIKTSSGTPVLEKRIHWSNLTEYTILGILLTLMAASYMIPTLCMTSCPDDSPLGNPTHSSKRKKRRPDNVKFSRFSKTPSIPALIIGFFYAVSDETHY